MVVEEPEKGQGSAGAPLPHQPLPHAPQSPPHIPTPEYPMLGDPPPAPSAPLAEHEDVGGTTPFLHQPQPLAPQSPPHIPTPDCSMLADPHSAPSAPLAEHEDVGGTTPASQGTPSHNENPRAPAIPNLQRHDAPDSAFTYGPSAPDLPPYSEDMTYIPSATPPPQFPTVTHGENLSPTPPSRGLPRYRAPPRVPPFSHKNVRAGVNLVRAARRLLTFLAEVDARPGLYSGPQVTRAIWRYEHCWLPLAARCGVKGCAPPLDVHWVWLVHMLAPQLYRTDCIAVTGIVVPHRLWTAKKLKVARERGRKLWEEAYPTEPWDVEAKEVEEVNKNVEEEEESSSSEDSWMVKSRSTSPPLLSQTTNATTTSATTAVTAASTTPPSTVGSTPTKIGTTSDTAGSTPTKAGTVSDAAGSASDTTGSTPTRTGTASDTAASTPIRTGTASPSATTTSVSSIYTTASTTRITYDLRAAVGRQSVFYYQVSLPHYRNKGFLHQSDRRYRQFLALKKAHPTQFLVPCYDVDLIWHAHQVHPEQYWKDTTALLGDLLPHDDSVNDRSPGSRLVTSDMVIRELWGRTYHNTFRREGSMFRGDPPKTYIHPVSEDVITSAHSSLYHCQIVKLTVRGKAPDGPLRIKVKHREKKVAELNVFHQQAKGVSEHNVADLDLTFSLRDQTTRGRLCCGNTCKPCDMEWKGARNRSI